MGTQKYRERDHWFKSSPRQQKIHFLCSPFLAPVSRPVENSSRFWLDQILARPDSGFPAKPPS